MCSVHFSTFWPSIFFFGGGEPPEFFDLGYTVEHSDHVTKFQRNQPRELGDLALKKQRPATNVLGGLIDTTLHYFFCQ